MCRHGLPRRMCLWSTEGCPAHKARVLWHKASPGEWRNGRGLAQDVGGDRSSDCHGGTAPLQWWWRCSHCSALETRCLHHTKPRHGHTQLLTLLLLGPPDILQCRGLHQNWCNTCGSLYWWLSGYTLPRNCAHRLKCSRRQPWQQKSVGSCHHGCGFQWSCHSP